MTSVVIDPEINEIVLFVNEPVADAGDVFAFDEPAAGEIAVWVTNPTAPWQNAIKGKTIGDLEIATLKGEETLENKTLVVYTEAEGELTGTTPEISNAGGSFLTWELTDASTPTIALDDGQSVSLHIDAGTNSITWPADVLWIVGETPALDPDHITVIELWAVGGDVYGALAGVAYAA